MLISCHFRDCKVLLATSLLTHVRCAGLYLFTFASVSCCYCEQADDIVSLIVDSSPVIVQQSTTASSSSSSSGCHGSDSRCHGELFYAVFKSSITEMLIGRDDAVTCLTSDEQVIEHRRRIIASVITAMLDLLARDTQLRHRCVYCIHLYSP